MSKFYGTVTGQASTLGTRRGSKDITVSAQSWDGSVVTRLYYNKDDELCVEVGISHDSTGSFYGARTVFNDTFAKYEELFNKEG